MATHSWPIVPFVGGGAVKKQPSSSERPPSLNAHRILSLRNPLKFTDPWLPKFTQKIFYQSLSVSEMLRIIEPIIFVYLLNCWKFCVVLSGCHPLVWILVASKSGLFGVVARIVLYWWASFCSPRILRTPEGWKRLWGDFLKTSIKQIHFYFYCAYLYPAYDEDRCKFIVYCHSLFA